MISCYFSKSFDDLVLCDPKTFFKLILLTCLLSLKASEQLSAVFIFYCPAKLLLKLILFLSRSSSMYSFENVGCSALPSIPVNWFEDVLIWSVGTVLINLVESPFDWMSLRPVICSSCCEFWISWDSYWPFPS